MRAGHAGKSTGSRAVSAPESLPAVNTGYGLEGGRFVLETRCSCLCSFQSLLYTNKWSFCRDDSLLKGWGQFAFRSFGPGRWLKQRR